jgi:AcrR family transcriptional regulator
MGEQRCTLNREGGGMAKYTLKRRAEQQEETRRRIVEAIVELHKTIGPVKTTITAIAEGAGVERLTVYRHFPNEVELFRACSDHWRAAHPPPDVNRWKAFDDPRERLQTALFDIYEYYTEVAPMLGNVLRDADLLPVLANQLAGYRHFVALAQSLLADGFASLEEHNVALRAAIGHAVSFDTWRSLVETQGLSAAQARDLMVALVRSVAEQASDTRVVTPVSGR